MNPRGPIDDSWDEAADDRDDVADVRDQLADTRDTPGERDSASAGREFDVELLTLAIQRNAQAELRDCRPICPLGSLLGTPPRIASTPVKIAI
jgi:hypothetical protein